MGSKLSKRHLLYVVILVLLVVVLVVALAGLRLTSQQKVGFIITGAATDDGWNGMHVSGITSVCEDFGVKLLIEENVAEGTGQCEQAVRRLAEEGVQMIVLSSFSYPSEIKETIAEYPDIAFYGISAEYSADNMTAYFGRVYEMRYLSGIIAAMQSETKQLGYVAAMPNSEVNRGINAFALGARSVDPDIQVNVIFTGAWDAPEEEIAAANRLISEYDSDVLTYHQNKHAVAKAADDAGVYSIGYNEEVNGLSEKYLTSVVWDWERLYYEIIREYVMGNANAVARRWYGASTGAVLLSEYSQAVSADTIAVVEAAKTSLVNGKNVFSGEIYDNTGVRRCENDEMLSDEILFEQMDWYVNGVVIYD